MNFIKRWISFFAVAIILLYYRIVDGPLDERQALWSQYILLSMLKEDDTQKGDYVHD